MKKSVIEEPIYKTVKKGTRKITQYVSEDGHVFYKEKECIDYEERVKIAEKWEKIETVRFDLEIPWVFYYASNEEELQLIKDRLVQKKKTIHGELKVGEWIGEYSDYDDDRPERCDIYTLSYIKEQIDNLLKTKE